jgi:proton glutamate symport protein
MSDLTTRPRRSLTRADILSGIAGIFLYACGIGIGIAGNPMLVTVLRWLALVVFTAIVARKPSLLLSTLLAMLAGIEIGLDFPRIALQLHFLGDLFLRLVRMIIAPLLLSVIATGIAGHSHLRSVGRIAIKSLVLFEVLTTIGLLFGAVAINLSGAGWGVALPPNSEPMPSLSQGVQTWQQVLLNVFPENIAQAIAQNQILQVAVFAVFFGCALAMLPEQKRAPVLSVLRSVADTMFQVTRTVMYLAPAAAGAALAYVVANTGLTALQPLGKLILTFYVTLLLFGLFVLLPILVFFRIPVGAFIRAVGEPAAIGFATTTSEAALPLAIERMVEFGVPRWIVSFVIPTGYSFNMIGSSLYLSMAAVFIAQASGIHLTVGRQITMLAILMLASKGVAGVPRAVLVVLLATAASVQLPTAPILLILGVDALMDMGRTTLNIVGNCLASAVIAQSEHELLNTSVI